VQAALAERGIPTPPTPQRLGERGAIPTPPLGPDELRARERRRLAFAAFAILVPMVALVVIVYLIVQAL
jgi:hypothetical protein